MGTRITVSSAFYAQQFLTTQPVRTYCSGVDDAPNAYPTLLPSNKQNLCSHDGEKCSQSVILEPQVSCFPVRFLRELSRHNEGV